MDYFDDAQMLKYTADRKDIDKQLPKFDSV